MRNHAKLQKDSSEWEVIGEPTEAALIVAAYKAWLSLSGDEKMAKNGLRTLAIAFRKLPKEVKLSEDGVENELTLLRVVAIMDPPRKEVPQAILMAKKAGVNIVMITGDNPDMAIAKDPQNGLLLAQTVAFTGIIVLEKVNVFNFRSLSEPMSVIGFFTNKWLLLAIAFSISLQICAVYVPFLQETLHTVALGWQDWGLIILVALPIFVVTEIYTRIRYATF